MKEKVLRILTSLLLIIQGILPIYGIFFTFSIYKNIPVLSIEGAIFFILAFFSYIKFHNRFVQWIAIIYSLIKGFGGFLGFGWIFAIILAVLYILGGKKKEQIVMQPPSNIPNNISNSNSVQTQQNPDQSKLQQ